MLKFKNIISIPILVSTILGGSTVLAKDSRIYENNINGGNGYKNFSQMAEISWDIKDTNDKSLYGQAFNCEIYADLGIKVYGEPTDIKDNIFQEKKDGYFKKDGKYGEWKYLGVDDFGQPFLNPFFIDVNLKNAIPIDVNFKTAKPRDWIKVKSLLPKNYEYMRYGNELLITVLSSDLVQSDHRVYFNALETPDGIKMKDFLGGRDPINYAVSAPYSQGQEIAYVWVLENTYDTSDKNKVIKTDIKTLVFSSHEKSTLYTRCTW